MNVNLLASDFVTKPAEEFTPQLELIELDK